MIYKNKKYTPPTRGQQLPEGSDAFCITPSGKFYFGKIGKLIKDGVYDCLWYTEDNKPLGPGGQFLFSRDDMYILSKKTVLIITSGK